MTNNGTPYLSALRDLAQAVREHIARCHLCCGERVLPSTVTCKHGTKNNGVIACPACGKLAQALENVRQYE